MIHLKRKGKLWGGGGYLQIKIFYFLSTNKHRENGKSTGKMQGKHREFGINGSVATLLKYTFKCQVVKKDVKCQNVKHLDQVGGSQKNKLA